MKIAYIILAHKYPEQLIRLIHRLNTENTSFFVHIDKKTDDEIYNQVVKGVSNLTNVYFLKRYDCYWGDFGQIIAPLEGIKEIFKQNVAFDWVVLLTGQCYPLKSNSHIEKFFREKEGKLFVDYYDLVLDPPDRGWPTSGSDRVDFWHFRINKLRFVFPVDLKRNAYNRYMRVGAPWFRILSAMWSGLIFFIPPIKRKFVKGYRPFRGSPYWCLPKECIEHLYNIMQKEPEYINFFKYVDIPDEMFFQTTILNSKFKDDVINDNLFYIDWDNPNPQIPRTFVKSDFERLASCQKLFARKFDMSRDAEILDMIDEKILTKDK